MEGGGGYERVSSELVCVQRHGRGESYRSVHRGVFCPRVMFFVLFFVFLSLSFFAFLFLLYMISLWFKLSFDKDT